VAQLGELPLIGYLHGTRRDSREVQDVA
jgi:hypothetical protein